MLFMNIIQDILDWLKGSSSKGPAPEPPGGKPDPVHRKVLMIIYNPPVPSQNGRKLFNVLGWNDPDTLCNHYIQDLHSCSAGYTGYSVTERVEVDHFPVKQDGFVYTADEYVACIQSNSGFHQPDMVDYQKILDEFDIVQKVNLGAIDEVWMFAFPYAGFYESRMVGPRAFFCNAPPLNSHQACTRRFIMMGFNVERGVGEMLEANNHRAESIMDYVYQRYPQTENLWKRFIRYDKVAPGEAEVGSVHFAPNSQKDYDWGNPRTVTSRCDTWYNFPDLSGASKMVNCSEWGNGDIRKHHVWWLEHFPRLKGTLGGVSCNWWSYVVDPNQAP